MTFSGGQLGKMLPIHFGPKEDEILSSWICRLALAHGLNSTNFCLAVLPRRCVLTESFRTLNVDGSAGEKVITVLSRKTGTPELKVRATTLAAYQGCLFERWTSSAGHTWTIPVNMSPRKTGRGIQYCPLCLTTEEPYFKRPWRLSLITLCTLHHVQLLNRCQRCASPVLFHKAIMNGRQAPPSHRMTFCYSCKADLRDVKSEKVGPIPTEGEVSFQERLEEALQSGRIEMPGGGTGYSLLYFPVLHRLMRLLAVGEKGTKLRASLSQRCGTPTLNITLKGKRPGLTQLTVGERQGLLQMARQLLINWPEDFIRFFTDNKVPMWDLLGKRERTPFWFWSVVNEHLNPSPYVVPPEEIESAVLCLRKMKRQYRRLPCPHPKEVRAVAEFLRRSSGRQRKIQRVCWTRVRSSGTRRRPRRISKTLWKKVEAVINSCWKFPRSSPSERRNLLDGMLYVLHTGCSWKEMPIKFGAGKSARNMYYQLKYRGVFEEVWALCSNLCEEQKT